MTPRLTRTSGSSEILAALLGAAAIVLGSATVGVVVNHFSPRGIPLFPQPGEQQLHLPPGVESLALEDAYIAFDENSALFVDARPPEEYAEQHIPGAVNVPPTDFEAHFLDWADEIETATRIVVICAGIECSDSIQVAERLLEIVDGPVYVIEEGWRAWQDAGYPAQRGAAP